MKSTNVPSSGRASGLSTQSREETSGYARLEKERAQARQTLLEETFRRLSGAAD